MWVVGRRVEDDSSVLGLNNRKNETAAHYDRALHEMQICRGREEYRRGKILEMGSPRCLLGV